MAPFVLFPTFPDSFEAPGEISEPAPDRVVSGAPRFESWQVEEAEDGRLFAGRWTSTPGAWRVHYTEWEYCMIRAGRGELRLEDGTSIGLEKGAAIILRPGLQGVFVVEETLTKDYVILLPPA